MADVTIRIVVADDHAVVREGLKALLLSAPGIEVVGMAADGEEAVRLSVTEQPDVIILDIAMPGMDGLKAAREIGAAAPGVGILMLTMHEDADTLREAMRAGAQGFLVKGAGQDQVRRAVYSVAAGDAVFAGGAVAREARDAVASRAHRAEEPFPQLSTREREVLDLLAAALTTPAIAQRLGISAKTVNNHLSSIFAKLGVSNRTEAALVARRAGLGDS